MVMVERQKYFHKKSLWLLKYYDPPSGLPYTSHLHRNKLSQHPHIEIDFEFVTACGTTSGTIGPISLVSPPDVSFEVTRNSMCKYSCGVYNYFRKWFSLQDCSEFAQMVLELWRWNTYNRCFY